MIFIIHTWTTLLVVLAFLLGWIPWSVIELQLCFQHYTKGKMNWCGKGVTVSDFFSIVFQEQHLFFSIACCSVKEPLATLCSLGLFFQAGFSCEIYLVVFRQGKQQLSNVYLLFVPMQTHHKMLPNQKGIAIFTSHQCDNTWCKAVEKSGL